MARIGIIGASGLLGHELVPALSGAGHDVVSMGRSAGSQLTVDLGNLDSVRDAIRQSGAKVFVNLAALTDVDACERAPDDAYRINVRSVENLAEALSDVAGAYLIQISTDQVYDGDGPHQEADVRLTNYYAFSKYAAELASARVSAACLRTNFFGPSSVEHRISLSDWVLRSLSARREITLFADVFFSPLTMHRLCSLIERVVAVRPLGVFNVGSTDGMSKADFASELAMAFGLSMASAKRGSVLDSPLLAHRPRDMRMDVTAFESAMGMRLPTLISEIHSLRSH